MDVACPIHFTSSLVVVLLEAPCSPAERDFRFALTICGECDRWCSSNIRCRQISRAMTEPAQKLQFTQYHAQFKFQRLFNDIRMLSLSICLEKSNL
jgi:hypothetical protein